MSIHDGSCYKSFMNEISKLQVFPVAPSGPFSKEQYETGIKIIEKMGLKIIKPIPFRHSEVSYLNGSDEERIGELNQAFKSDEKTILWVARGGYGVTRILAHLKISRKKKVASCFGIFRYHSPDDAFMGKIQNQKHSCHNDYTPVT